MTTNEELRHNEDMKWKRLYEYVCLFCRVKRKTRKWSVARERFCNACKEKKLAEAFEARQMKLFS